MLETRLPSFHFKLVLIVAMSVCGVAGADIPGDMLTPDNLSPYFEREIPSVASKDIAVSYRAADSGGAVSQVDLWVTRDRGTTWTKYESERPEEGLKQTSKRRNVEESKRQIGVGDSIAFHAEGEGLYGFYLVLHNAAGASSPPPTPGTAPQQWVRVDLSAPIAKILSVRAADNFGDQREVTIRWEVLDDNLAERPVTVYARTEQSKMYRPIAELQAAASEFRWGVPRSVAGRVEIKVAATDRAGHSARAVFEDLHVTAPPVVTVEEQERRNDETTKRRIDEPGESIADSEWVGPPVMTGDETFAAHGEPDAGTDRIDPIAAQDAQRQYELATWHRLRGEVDVAIVRYRKALEHDPRLSSARHDLAAMLLLDGSIKEADTLLTQLVKDEPNNQQALKTLALVQSRQRNYRSAAATLQKLLLLAPDDAEVWLSFGDVALFMGDREQARTAWGKVESLESATVEHRRKASKRLELYHDPSVAAQFENSQ